MAYKLIADFYAISYVNWLFCTSKWNPLLNYATLPVMHALGVWKECGVSVIKQLISPLYLLYNPDLENVNPIAYEVATVEGLDEVAKLVKQQTGHVHFIDLQEFLQYKGVERLTDDCTKPVGMSWNADEDSVFYIFIK